MITINRCTFRRADPSDRVHVVVTRQDSPGLSPSRYLTAKYASSSSAVLLAFSQKEMADEVSRRVVSCGSRFVCPLTLRDAEWLSFNRLRMDVVVVFSVDDEWEVHYGKRNR